MKTTLYEITLAEEDDGRWAATCPALPGCATWGGSRSAALRNIQEAVTAYVADVTAAGNVAPAGQHSIDGPAMTVITS